ncbi:hypothetical protein ACHAW5_000022 [Stephanodiscus triporus]|uniref:Corrinoid adenosyltransferase MMAB n=1 Tax=Stephanodiscus triporus TaxID=2934178 RepID=A0ABD3QZR2_9STRA
MISPVAAYAPAIARTVSLASTPRHQALRSTTTWLSYSASAQSKRQDDGDDRVRNLRINQDASSSKFLRPHSDDIMEGPAATGRGNEKPAVAPFAVADIEDIHRRAIMEKQSTYIDPHTDFTVFTELAHLKRGKCCGNQCRHCPYGWSNVRNMTEGGVNDASARNVARAMSGDRVGTARLVKRIQDGTYYEEDERSRYEITHQASTGESARLNGIDASHTTESTIDAVSQAAKPKIARGQGEGGSAGGTLTSKNVPYTRKGDAGTSQLFTGEIRSKDDVLFEALGTVDELCSIVGVVYAELNVSRGEHQLSGDVIDEAAKIGPSEKISSAYGGLPEQLLDVMSRLFDVGSHIARPTPRDRRNSHGERENGGFHSHHTVVLEEWIDTMTDELPELLSFIIPTGSPASAQLHVARTVCRRAERRMVPLVHDAGTVDPAALAYVNRLSDYFFTAARFVNYCDGIDEVQYRVEERVLGDDSGKGANFHRERVVVKLKK